MSRAVLDASAVIALVRGDPGAEKVAEHLGGALISTVTLQEVVKALLVRGLTLDAVRTLIDGLNLETRPHQIQDAYAAAALFAATRSKGSGLGDRTCMALAIAEGLPAITTDRAWTELAIPGLSVLLAR